MKLVLIFLSISICIFSSKTINHEKSRNLETKSKNDDDDLPGEKAKEKVDFNAHFMKEIKDNNTGDLGSKKENKKFQQFTDIVKALATEFGVDIIFPQTIIINENTVSKLEVSFSIAKLNDSYAEKMKHKLDKYHKIPLVTDSMEYQVLVK
jgi:hypothetical protein